MSDPPRPLLRVQELLREQRYRRSFLHDDRRQHARILAILAAQPRGWPDYKKMEKFQELAPNLALDAPRKALLDELV